MAAPRRDEEFRMLSKAVHSWFDFYEVEPDDRATALLTNAALQFFDDGYRTVEDIATMLIGTYVGKWATRVNAPSSDAFH